MLSNNTSWTISNITEDINGTSEGHSDSSPTHTSQIVTILMPIYWTLAGVIVVLNGALLYLYLRDKAVRQSLNHFIVSLIVTDIVFGMVGIPLLQKYPRQRFARGIDLSDGACVLTLILQMGIVTMVPWGVAFIAVDRLIAVERPTGYKHLITNRRSTVAVTSLWLFVFFFHTLPLMNLDSIGGEQWRDYCSGHYRYPIAYRHALVYLLLVSPIILTAVCYIAMYVVIKRKGRQSALTGGRESQPSFQKAVRAAKTCLLTTLLVCLGWVPYLGFMVVLPLVPNVSYTTRTYSYSITFLFAAAVSAANPLVYIVRSHTIKIALRRTFSKRVAPVNGSTNAPTDPSSAA